jgi:hypothetical protein
MARRKIGKKKTTRRRRKRMGGMGGGIGTAAAKVGVGVVGAVVGRYASNFASGVNKTVKGVIGTVIGIGGATAKNPYLQYAAVGFGIGFGIEIFQGLGILTGHQSASYRLNGSGGGISALVNGPGIRAQVNGPGDKAKVGMMSKKQMDAWSIVGGAI